MNQSKDNEWLQDYEEFINGEGAEVPKEIKDRVYNKIQKLINPNAMIVFLKILLLSLLFYFI